MASVRRVDVMGQGGTDTLTIDTSNGAVALPEGITFDGGSQSDTLVLNGHKASKKTETVGSVSTLTYKDRASRKYQIFKYQGVETLTDNMPETTVGDKIADAFSDFWEWLTHLFPSSSNSNYALVGDSVPRALNGAPPSVSPPVTDPTSGGPEPEGESEAGNGLGILRILETGTGSFQLSDVGSALIPDLEAFRHALDLVGDGVDNGTVTYTDVGGVITFHARINKELDGGAALNVTSSQFGGAINFAGSMEIAMDVTLEVTFGWANINNPSSVSGTASVGIGQDVINFLRFGAENVLDQLKALKEDLNTLRASAGLTINGQRSSAFSIAGNLGFPNDALDKLLDFVHALDQEVI